MVPIPIIYSTISVLSNVIQRNNGFLRYYEIQQLPNFALASPVFLLSFSGIALYLRNHNFLSMQFLFPNYNTLGAPQNVNRARNTRKSEFSQFSEFSFLGDSRLFAFCAHLLFAALTALLVMNVQVATRFLFSQSPFLYWIMADLATNSARSPHWRRFLFVYCGIFIIAGTALFSNFLPWT